MMREKTCLMQKEYMMQAFLMAVLCFSLYTPVSHGQENNDQIIHLYLDADQTGNRASGIAIERGIRVALHEVDNKLNGQPVKLIVRDHHGSSLRSKRHLEEYLADEKALAVFSGLHSPPLLENLPFIHKSQILILDPWAAAGPITRFPSKENWVFRLSVDDSKAGAVIVKEALREGFKQPYLLLENTGWGKSNHRTMIHALNKRSVIPSGVQWFNWNIGLRTAKMMLRDIYASGADVIFLVANSSEGKTFAKAMLALLSEKNNNIKSSLPIRSHWGITGGDFPKVISYEVRQYLDLKFLQTRFSFNSSKPTPLSKHVLEQAKQLYPEQIRRAEDITAPAGFIHAYDLSRLLIAAVNQSSLGGDIRENRKTIRRNLENIKQPVQGLIKNYIRPFQVFDENNPDAHEALDENDLVMGNYNKDGHIVIGKD